MQFSFDPNLRDIAFKVEDGERLTFDEGLALYNSTDLNAVGKLADHVRRRKHSLTTYYNVNRHFNHTNICVADCKFCGFYKRARQEGAYTHSIQAGIDIARTAVGEGATELHIVGGLNSKLPFEYYTDLFSSLKREFPKLHLKALTMVELDFFARFYKMSDEEVIEKLHAAGMDSCPGGGAEIFAEPTRSRICDHKCDADRWLELAGKVHKAGLKTNATMLYGHIESVEDRVDHLVRLRELQDETGGFVTYIPLAFQPWEAPAMSCPETTGFEDLKAIAVGRLMLDNFPHVKSYWIMIGPRLAQVGLSFGADDIDGTVTEEKIAHDAGAPTAQSMTVHELVRLVREAVRRPIERDTVFNVVKEW